MLNFCLKKCQHKIALIAVFISFTVASALIYSQLLQFPVRAEPNSSQELISIPQTCPAIPCKEGYTCKDGNCVQCGGDETFPPIEQSSLREYAAKRGLLTSAIIQLRWLDAFNNDTEKFGPEHLETLKKEFSTLHIASWMKNLAPTRNESTGKIQYRFDIFDEKVEFARENNIRVWVSPLVYGVTRYATPDWLRFDEPNCGGWSKQELDAILRNYIKTVVGHGRKKGVFAYNVVNEGIIQTAGAGCWLEVLGDDYIPKAFQYAREADPNALLILDDGFGRGGVEREKTDKFFDELNRYKQNGVPIDIAGIHMRLDLRELRWDDYQNEFQYFLERAEEAEVQVWITEMDVYQGNYGLEKQKEVYKNIVATCLKYPHCTMFAHTHISDKNNYWRSVYPNLVPIPKPALFDENYQRKPAYFGVMEALRENTTRACILGDANRDGVVDEVDLELLKQDYLGEPVNNTDFNSDGRVDSEDFAILQVNYQRD